MILTDLIIVWKLTTTSIRLNSELNRLLARIKTHPETDPAVVESYDKVISLAQRALQFVRPKYLRTAEFSSYKLQLLLEDDSLDITTLSKLVKQINMAITLQNLDG